LIILDATNRSLEVVLSAATNVDYTTSYVDVTTTTYTPASSDGATASTSATTIVSAPSASTQRQIKQITIHNTAATANIVTIQYNTATVIKILCKTTLQPYETLQYSDGESFSVIAFNSGIKLSHVPSVAFSASTQSGNTGNIVFANSNSISFGMTGTTTNSTGTGPGQLTLTASVSRSIIASHFEVPHAHLSSYTVNTAAAFLNLSLQRFVVPYDVVATRLDLLGELTHAFTSGQVSWSVSVGVYTRSGLTLNTASTTYSSVTCSPGGGTANTSNYGALTQLRWRAFTSLGAGASTAWNFTPGEYWFGMINTLPAVGTASGGCTFYGNSFSNIIGIAGTGAGNDTYGNAGLYSATTGAFPNAISLTEVIYQDNNTAASSGSFVLRQPYFRMFGTF
jgi:hypothetical protein